RRGRARVFLEWSSRTGKRALRLEGVGASPARKWLVRRPFLEKSAAGTGRAFRRGASSCDRSDTRQSHHARESKKCLRFVRPACSRSALPSHSAATTARTPSWLRRVSKPRQPQPLLPP